MKKWQKKKAEEREKENYIKEKGKGDEKRRRTGRQRGSAPVFWCWKNKSRKDWNFRNTHRRKHLSPQHLRVFWPDGNAGHFRSDDCGLARVEGIFENREFRREKAESAGVEVLGARAYGNRGRAQRKRRKIRENPVSASSPTICHRKSQSHCRLENLTPFGGKK